MVILSNNSITYNYIRVNVTSNRSRVALIDLSEMYCSFLHVLLIHVIVILTTPTGFEPATSFEEWISSPPP